MPPSQILKPAVQDCSRPDPSPDGADGECRAGRLSLGAVAVVCAIFLATAVYRLNHTDLWAHLSFGRWIVENGRLPDADPFRTFLSGQPFLNVPWLAQVLGYFCHETLGLEGLVLAHALMVTLAAAILIAAVRRRGLPIGWGAMAAAAGYLLALPVVGTIRPQLFGVLAFGSVLYGIACLPHSSRPLLWLPLVFAAWANLHGSFPMGLVVLACLALARTWERGRRGGSDGRLGPDPLLRRTWLALILALAGSCLNPIGPRLLWAVSGFAGNSNLEGISEWEPMVLESLSGALFFGSLVATAVLIRVSPRRIMAAEVLLLLVFGAASLLAIRMLVWWSLVWPWVAAPHAAAAWRKKRLADAGTDPGPVDLPPPGMRFVLTAGMMLATVWWAPPTYALMTSRPRPPAAILSHDTPAALADWIVRERISGRTFAPIDWADYLIWRTRGAVEPLVFSHVHLTEPDVWRDFLLIRSAADGWPDVADRHGLDYLVLSRDRNRPLVASASGHPRCEVLHVDSQGLLVRLRR
jgi:hypothetical protein